MPKAVPLVVSNPIILPSMGKITAREDIKEENNADRLRNLVVIRVDHRSRGRNGRSPQIEEPTPTKTEILLGMRINLCNRKAMTRETKMVQIIIGSDCFPVSTITPRFKPKPSKITAACKIFWRRI